MSRIIECEITGAAAKTDDVDQLARMIEGLNDSIASMREAKAQAVRALVELTEAAGDTRQTRHLAGASAEVKLTMPKAVEYDSGVLRDIYKRTPEVWRDRLLRVERVALNAREWKKWKDAATSDPVLAEAQRAIISAERPSARQPTVSVKVASDG